MFASFAACTSRRAEGESPGSRQRMKLFFAALALLIGIGFWPLFALAEPVPGRVLILTVSAQDQEAAARLRDLSPVPAMTREAPDARDPHAARATLLTSDAQRAVVLDSAQRTVSVVERDGSERTRLIDGSPTPYIVAFVASELLALEPLEPQPKPTAAPVEVKAHVPAQVLARFDGALALDVARAYTKAWVVRPKIALGFWFAKRGSRRVWPLLGLELAGPARTERNVPEAGRVSALRWDGAVRLGAALGFQRARALVYARGQIATQRAEFSGAQGNQRTVSLGLGGGLSFELGLTSWLALCAGTELGGLPRRSQLTVHGTPALRESLLWFSASLGLVLHTPLAR